MKKYIYNAEITNIVDGDTFDAVVDLGFCLTAKLRFRLYGVNTSEMTSSIPEERALAVQARSYLSGAILNKKVILETFKSDAFGRYLCNVIVDNLNINDELLRLNLAKVYKK